MFMLHIKLKGMKYTTACKKYVVLTRILDPKGRSKGQDNFLSENGFAAYQIKENDTYNKMPAIILSFQAPPNPGVVSKQFSLKVAMLLKRE